LERSLGLIFADRTRGEINVTENGAQVLSQSVLKYKNVRLIFKENISLKTFLFVGWCEKYKVFEREAKSL
jgi:hypothetical protein